MCLFGLSLKLFKEKILFLKGKSLELQLIMCHSDKLWNKNSLLWSTQIWKITTNIILTSIIIP